jgi:hemerythrin
MIKLLLIFILSCMINLQRAQSIKSNNTHLKATLVDELFYKYSNTTNSLSLSDLANFLENFPKLIFSNSKIDSNHEAPFNCLHRNVLKISNLTNLLNNQTVVDKKKFSVISLFLVSYIEKCLSENDAPIEEFQRNSTEQEINSQRDFFKSVFNYNQFVYLYENALNLKLESKSI